MSKKIDFAKERRDQGRSLSSAVRDLTAMMEPLAHQHGIDLQTILDEASARKEEEKRPLTERLLESVVPLFIYRDRQLISWRFRWAARHSGGIADETVSHRFD